MKIFDDRTEIYESIDRLVIGINTVSIYISRNNIENIEGIHFYLTPEFKAEFCRIMDDEYEEVLLRSKIPWVFFNKVLELPDGIVVKGDYYSNETKEIVNIITNKIN